MVSATYFRRSDCFVAFPEMTDDFVQALNFPSQFPNLRIVIPSFIAFTMNFFLGRYYFEYRFSVTVGIIICD